MHISSAFFEQPTPFPHIPLVYSSFTTHFNILPINFRRTNNFGVYKSYRQMRFTGSGIKKNFFYLFLITTANGGKMTTEYYAIYAFTLAQRRLPVFRGSARVSCAATMDRRLLLHATHVSRKVVTCTLHLVLV
jgi:hypothetical protein